MEDKTSTSRIWLALEELSRNGKLAFHVAVFAVAFLILFSRRPDAILNAQFYAEDGKYWYADAYQFGWGCSLIPRWGYLQTVSRLIGLFSLVFPFTMAPLVMNLCALAFQILPVNLFLSSRFSAIPFQTRFLGSLLYLSLPNSFEVHANTTNLQWHLALAAALVVLGRAEGSRTWRFLDLSLVALSILDGPVGMLVIPIAVAVRWTRERARSSMSLLALAPVILLQALVILFSHGRPPGTNGASLARLTSILGGQLFLSSVLGLRTFIQLYFAHVHFLFLIQGIAMATGLAVMLYVLRYGPVELKLFLMFAAAVLSLSLIRPFTMLEADREQWRLLLVPGIANRYYFLPMIAFLASLVWLVQVAASTAAARFMRHIALVLLALLPVGIYRDWIYRPFPDLDFKEFASDFERAAPGTKITIPINPVTWEMQLTKR